MWGVPVDHDMFSNINSVQWMWYFHNFMEDREESFVDRRDLVEYHASFIEPEAVKKIREARETAVEIPHEEFVAGIEHFFGRKIGISNEQRKGSESIAIDPKIAIQKSETFKKQQVDDNTVPSKIDYGYGLNFNLE